jgi:class 3 adenylate cyclase/predicted ATPase
MSEIGRWLDQIGLGQHAAAFAENAIELDVLPDLTDEHLKELGLPLGHRLKLLKAIAGLQSGAGPATSALPEAASAAKTTPTAERRQLTVMFCDLVGSTALSQRLDPEDLREVMRRYQDAVAGAVARYQGHVAKFLGDGVLAIFGWPQAYEDQAERAVRAGLETVTAIVGLETELSLALQARVGIATGLVVVGDLLGEVGAVSGETPNLAARLQEVAAAGDVVISASTRQLIGEAFGLESLGLQTLKGFREALPAWRVTGEAATSSRFEAAHLHHLTALVGRGEEVELLLRRWQQVTAGEGQIVLLSGEAGIGKSRITLTLADRIGKQDIVRLLFQCSPYHTNSALYPFIHHLERASGMAPADEPETKLEKLEALLARSMDDIGDVIPLFAALFSVPLRGRYLPLGLTPQIQKERTLEALGDWFLALAARQPVFLLFEDVHWADPTTLEALQVLIERVQDARLLGVLTFRPEFAPPWHRHGHMTALALNRLSREQCTALVQQVARGDALPDEVVDQIVAKTDGVPLFIEELTKTVIESGILKAEGSRYYLAGPLPIPSTLQASLTARLDRSAPVKEVAQMGAAIGREFSYRLLAELSPPGERDLEGALTQLVASELVFRRGVPPDATYTFKHALVQEVAYGSLLRGRRQALHRSIAEALETKSPETAESQPEILAHHYTEAGDAENAIAYWHKAGRRAADRSANLEAIANISKGLALLDNLPISTERDRLELSLRIALGPIQMAAHGVPSVQAELTYERVQELAESVGDADSQFTALYGIWQVNNMRGNVGVSSSIARDMLAATERGAESGFQLQAHHTIWTSNLFGGHPEISHRHSCQGVEIYDEDVHRSHKFLYGGHDPGACCLVFKGLGSWFLGHPERGVTVVAEGLALADKLAHPMSSGITHLFAAAYYHLRRDPEETERLASIGVELCAEHGIKAWAPAMVSLRGWARAELEGGDAAAEIAVGMNMWQAMGHNIFKPWFLSLQADADRRAGRAQQGIEKTDQGLAHAGRSGEHWFDAELHRIRGDLLLSLSARNKQEAETEFRQAISIARAQKAKSLELRAATRLARHWGENKKRAAALRLLGSIYDCFTEGFDTADLKEARALLEALSGAPSPQASRY